MTSIRSPRSNSSPTAGEPIATPVTSGGPPSTLWLALFSIAFVPSPRLAATVPSRASLIDPLFSVSAVAPMLIPSVSASAFTTVYWKVKLSVPEPDA